MRICKGQSKLGKKGDGFETKKMIFSLMGNKTRRQKKNKNPHESCEPQNPDKCWECFSTKQKPLPLKANTHKK